MKNQPRNFSILALTLLSMSPICLVMADTNSFAPDIDETAVKVAFNVTEKTSIKEINQQMGIPLRDLLDKKDYGSFIDLYSNTFSVLRLGNKHIMYRLSNDFINDMTKSLFEIRPTTLSQKVAKPSVLGLNLGMRFEDAQQAIYALPSFNGVTVGEDGKTQYQLLDGSYVAITPNENNAISTVELHLNPSAADQNEL